MMIEVAGGLNSILTVLLSKSCLIEHIGCKFFRFRKCLNSSNVVLLDVQVWDDCEGKPTNFWES